MLFDKGYDALTNPKAAFAAEKKNSSVLKGIRELVAGAIVYILLYSILSLAGGVSLLVFGFAAVLTFLIIVVGVLVENVIYFIIAKLLGGKGTFKEQFYLIALFTAPLVVLTILNALPFVGIFIYALLMLYSFYPRTIAIKEAHQLSTLRAVAVWLIPLIIMSVLVVGVLVMIGFLGWIPGMAGTLRERQANQYWAAAYPLAIMEYDITSSGATFLIQNVGDDPVIIKNMSVTSNGVGIVGNPSPSEYKLDPGAEKEFIVFAIKCVKGSDYELTNIILRYDVVRGISGQFEVGDRPLIGNCSG